MVPERINSLGPGWSVGNIYFIFILWKENALIKNSVWSGWLSYTFPSFGYLGKFMVCISDPLYELHHDVTIETI